MDLDDDLPRRADDPLNRLIQQDLEPLSLVELEARVATLEGEITRTRSKIESAVNHRSTAEALFKR
ncbi:Uncharacterized small protein, DUF1192 family [Sphingobium faniae]|nr:Uncharacterized small protein, DUF1192 family [Sphingobium faniae]